MTTLEHELLEKFRQLNEKKQREVLEFVERIDSEPSTIIYSARELMKLPPDERNRIVKQALQNSWDQDVELLETFDEADFDDE